MHIVLGFRQHASQRGDRLFRVTVPVANTSPYRLSEGLGLGEEGAAASAPSMVRAPVKLACRS